MQYYLQTKARAGNWVSCLGSDRVKDVQDHAKYLLKNGTPKDELRIVLRIEVPLETFAEESQEGYCQTINESRVAKSALKGVNIYSPVKLDLEKCNLSTYMLMDNSAGRISVIHLGPLSFYTHTHNEGEKA